MTYDMPPPDLQQIPDSELWSMIMDGNVPAYAELYERYWETLFETAYWHLLDKAAAKDIVQEVFVYCWQKREQIQINESMAAVRDFFSGPIQMANSKR
ncbi:RNA polymerase sigma factor [Niastella yeongjuensis]|nr:hypothetical protein [Niastella yeongjuensis]